MVLCPGAAKAGALPGQISQRGDQGTAHHHELQAPGVWHCSSAELEWLWPRGDSAPSPARYGHTRGTNCLKCRNGSTEEGFIIEVIAVFSRLTFVSGAG